jgi:predicted AlkP superfamily pyrophosphatase or phosphodiesterase
MRRVVVLNVVGLSAELIGEHTPNLARLVREGGVRALRPPLPAVTCTVQSSFTTGLSPREHGVVANGWYRRDVAEVALWKQSNRLVAGEKIWEAARKRDSDFTCANLFFWFNMYGSVDWSATPRPIYWADGLKLPDFYTSPPGLHRELEERLGPFPLFDFWGPRAGLRSSEWIAAAARHLCASRQPTLTLIYLPHLDYVLQREGPRGPSVPKELRAVDGLCGELIEQAGRQGARVLVLSEYGITEVRGAVHVNRALREAGLVSVREERGREKLDPGASEAFAVADHQLAHVYLKRPERAAEIRALLAKIDGVAEVLDAPGKERVGLDHPRSGELVAVSERDRWFSYYYWLDDDRAPEFARTVDIHRKPGYDPLELFHVPRLRLARARIAWTLLKKKLGQRTLLEVIPLDTTLVRGSHGRLPETAAEGPVVISSEPDLLAPELDASDVKQLVREHLFADEARVRGAA